MNRERHGRLMRWSPGPDQTGAGRGSGRLAWAAGAEAWYAVCFIGVWAEYGWKEDMVLGRRHTTPAKRLARVVA